MTAARLDTLPVNKVTPMMNKAAILCLLASSVAGAASAQEGAVPKGVPHLDHVFVIMMENHAYAQVVGNPNEPFVNKICKIRELRRDIISPLDIPA